MGGEPPDAEVVSRSLDDPGRFGEIFERHYPAVRAYLGRRLVADDADEVASETFVQAFRTRARFDAETGTVRAWLFGIATNLLRRHWRREERRLRAYARIDLPPADDAIADADARTDAQREGSAIAEALASLPGRERDVLLLHAWADLSHDEIATALGIPAGTVRSRLSRGRATVRERLALIGEDHGETARRREPHHGRP